MNVKQGLVKYGEKGSQAVLKELRQLHNIGALLPVKKEDMSYDVKRKVLRYLMFLKEKCDGTIQARGCVDGRPQRLYTTKKRQALPLYHLNNDAHLCNRCKRKQVHCSYRYFQCFPTCRYGGDSTPHPRKRSGRINREPRTDNIC